LDELAAPSRQRDTQTYIETDRHTQRQTERHTDRQTDTVGYTVGMIEYGVNSSSKLIG